jgi:hypothetical protein
MARHTPGSPPGWSWAQVPCTVQLPVDWHAAVIGPPPVLQVPLHMVPATELLPQSKLPPAGALGMPVHTARRAAKADNTAFQKQQKPHNEQHMHVATVATA